jgi:hypothetical protein
MDPDRPAGAANLRLPPVLGLTELIAVLGVSKTRVAGLIKQPGFPTPIAELSMGRVWDTRQIADYCAARGSQQRAAGHPDRRFIAYAPFRRRSS